MSHHYSERKKTTYALNCHNDNPATNTLENFQACPPSRGLCLYTKKIKNHFQIH